MTQGSYKVFGSKEKSRQKLARQVRDALGAPDWLESVDVDDTGRVILV
ncbi:MAG: ATP-binding protein involved in chromosome partitioning, partial [Hyphomonas sp.]